VQVNSCHDLIWILESSLVAILGIGNKESVWMGDKLKCSTGRTMSSFTRVRMACGPRAQRAVGPAGGDGDADGSSGASGAGEANG
jgi:hypothetical protein